ncbi:MAG TPA: GNA1162 family protein, partial [Nitrospiraceae bacterium]|nr:GNA1162 family protein [Nitrospiraceae bacterium]
TITDWTTTYVVLSSNITVGAEYRLVDAGTGAVLWTGTQKVIQSSGGGGGGGLAGLIVATVQAAVTATTVQYRPIAIQANNMAASRSGYGFPAGPYHPEFQKDREQFK